MSYFRASAFGRERVALFQRLVHALPAAEAPAHHRTTAEVPACHRTTVTAMLLHDLVAGASPADATVVCTDARAVLNLAARVETVRACLDLDPLDRAQDGDAVVFCHGGAVFSIETRKSVRERFPGGLLVALCECDLGPQLRIVGSFPNRA